MFKWINLLSVLVFAEIYCMEADTVYQLALPNFEAVKRVSADSNSMQEFSYGLLKKIEKSSEEEEILKKTNLGIFALVHKNWQICPATEKSYNYEFLQSVFSNIDELEKREILPCIYLVIDDAPEDVITELFDIIKTYSEKNKRMNIYLSKNDGNVGVEKGRIKLFSFARNYGLPYFCVLDSDDILSPYCLPVMYQAMLSNPEAVVGLGEYTLVSFPDADRKVVDVYLKKQCGEDVLSGFDINVYSKESRIKYAAWHTVGNTFLSHFIFNDPNTQNSSCSKSSGFLPMIFKNKEDASLDIEDTDMAYWCDKWINPEEYCLIILPKSDGENSYLYGYRGHGCSHSHSPQSYSKDNESMLLGYVVRLFDAHYMGQESTNFTLVKLIDEITYIDFLKDCYNKFDI